MSVPKYKRGESKFDVFVKAKELSKYTLQITSNEKVFCEPYKYLVQRLNDSAIKIFTDAWTANNIMAKTKETAIKRLSYIQDSILECRIFLSLIELSYTTFHLKSKRFNFWIGKVIEEKALLSKWYKSEKERYQSLL